MTDPTSPPANAAVAHLAHFRWKPGTTPEQIAQVELALAEIRPLMDGLTYYAFGPDLAMREGNADFAVVGVFSGVEAYRAYAQHPEHLRVLNDVIMPILEARSAVQLAVPGLDVRAAS